ncbi:MAG: hypothetical protein ACRD4O_07415, partial [Bryobacteraceae bacterium]
MNRPPFSVIVIGCLYVVTGVIELAFQLAKFRPRHPFPYDVVWVSLIGLIAIVCGVYMLRGRNWARWLATAWIAFHVAVSVFDAWFALAVHSVL